MSNNNNRHEEVFSRKVLAGKRTYFIDVKATKSNEYYVTITESKRRTGDDGAPFYEKHKIFLYEEDFGKFMESFRECLNYVDGQLSQNPPAPRTYSPAESDDERKSDESKSDDHQRGSSFTDVSFDDLK